MSNITGTFHKLKIKQEFAELFYQGLKPWELRKNDRDFKPGDVIQFKIIETGSTYILKVTSVFTDHKYGLKKGYCILTVKHLTQKDKNVLGW